MIWCDWMSRAPGEATPESGGYTVPLRGQEAAGMRSSSSRDASVAAGQRGVLLYRRPGCPVAVAVDVRLLISGVGCAAFGLFADARQPRRADAAILIEWIWPPLPLLIAYWSSGLLFVAPSLRTGSRRCGGSMTGSRYRTCRRRIASHPSQKLSRRRTRASTCSFPSRSWLLLALSPSPDPDRVLVSRSHHRLRLLRRAARGSRPARRARSKAGEPWSRLFVRSTCDCSARRASRSTRFRAGTRLKASPPFCSCSRAPPPIVALMFARGARRLGGRRPRPLSLPGRRAGRMGCGAGGVPDRPCPGSCRHFSMRLGPHPQALEPRAFALARAAGAADRTPGHNHLTSARTLLG